LYKRIILDTTHFKAMMTMNLSENSAIKRVFMRVVPRWVTSWEAWFGEAKSGQYCVIRGRIAVTFGLQINVAYCSNDVNSIKTFELRVTLFQQ